MVTFGPLFWIFRFQKPQKTLNCYFNRALSYLSLVPPHSKGAELCTYHAFIFETCTLYN